MAQVGFRNTTRRIADKPHAPSAQIVKAVDGSAHVQDASALLALREQEGAPTLCSVEHS